MASLISVRPHDRASPLQESTNSITNSYFLPSIDGRPCEAALFSTRPSVQQSSKTPRFNIGSSDTFRSKSDSIFDAERVLFEELEHKEQWLSRLLPSNDKSFELSSLAKPTDELRISFPTLCNHQSTISLEPIMEEETVEAVRHCSSMPQLQPSPERLSEIVTSRVSTHSVRPPFFSLSPAVHDLDDSAGHTRSFSLNDLDCFPKSDTKHALTRYAAHLDTSSSEAAFETARFCQSFPLRPTYMPPYRSPTPPGLPSFRSREAQELRLVHIPVESRTVSFLRKWLRRDHKGCENQIRRSLDVAAPHMLSPVGQATQTPPVMMLQKALGMSRFVEYERFQTQNPRSTLPLCIKVAPKPGALARADDGTTVRGHWGGRISAHGVGQQALDRHPLRRAAGLHSIDDVIAEIDKACDTTDEQGRIRHVFDTRSIRSSAEVTRTAGRNGHCVKSGLGPPGSLTAKNTFNLDCLYCWNPFRSRISAMADVNRPASSVVPIEHMRMVEPLRYRAVSLQGSGTQDGMDIDHANLESGEGHQPDGHSLGRRKEDEPSCGRYYAGSWMYICRSNGH